MECHHRSYFIMTLSFTQSAKFLRIGAKSEDVFSKNELLSWPIFEHFGPFFAVFWPFVAKLSKNVPNLTISFAAPRLGLVLPSLAAKCCVRHARVNNSICGAMHLLPFLSMYSEPIPPLRNKHSRLHTVSLLLTIAKKLKEIGKLRQNQKWQTWPPKCPKTYLEPKMAPKMGKGGRIWLKCITGDLIMKTREKKITFLRGSRKILQIWHGITRLQELRELTRQRRRDSWATAVLPGLWWWRGRWQWWLLCDSGGKYPRTLHFPQVRNLVRTSAKS